MTREQWGELFAKVDDMPVEELEKVVVDSARKADVLQTNADLVRQMSDEGIEDWYWWMHKEMTYYTDSRVFVHDWLKATVEEVQDGT